MGKRYYWLKLKDDFFSSKQIKKLRKMAGGDRYTIIYLKMQLQSLKKDGVLEYAGLEASFAEELALELDESEEDVQIVMNYLISCGLAKESEHEILLPDVIENTGSEGAGAQRMRALRLREAEKRYKELNDIQSVTFESQCDTSESQRDTSVTESQRKRKSQEIRDIDKRHNRIDSTPKLEDVEGFCSDKGLNANPQEFFEYYSKLDWMVDGIPVRNWKGLMISWDRKDNRNGRNKKAEPDGIRNHIQGIRNL